ncbi:MAG TPA: VOC family protein [Chitinophagaceae bacterium]|nr:VOC family protein [Chitinophagaceae bacterium]
MQKVTGLGGIFLKANDPAKLAAWYQEHLGINFTGNYADIPLLDKDGKPFPGSNLISFFKQTTEYFSPSTSPVMINLRVHDLFALLDQLRKENVEIVGDPMDEEYGKFGWILDPEGNKIELWQPPDK